MVTLYRSKTAAEKFLYTFDFTNSLPDGITIAAAPASTATATKASDGTTDDTILVSTTMTISSPTASIQVTGGTSGETYRIACTVVGSTAASWTKVVYLVLRVQDPTAT